MSIGFFSSGAVSIQEQLRILMRRGGFNQQINVLTPSPASAISNSHLLNKYQYGVFFIDPFFYLPIHWYKGAILYFTVDGEVESNEILKQNYRNLCRRFHCFANSEYSKANLEASGIEVEGVVHNAVDDTVTYNELPKLFDVGMLGFYNYPIGEKWGWVWDRKGIFLASIILYRLIKSGLNMRVFAGSNTELVDFVVNRLEGNVTIHHWITDNYAVTVSVTPLVFKPLTIFKVCNSLECALTSRHSFTVLLMGGYPKSTVYSLYTAMREFLFPSLTEGFGVPPLEALFTGTPVIVNEYQTAREILGTAPTECVDFIPFRYVKRVHWGLRDMGLHMSLRVPNVHELIRVLEDRVSEPRKGGYACREWVLSRYGSNAYDPLIKIINEWK
jgi:glycosyltransferase involved in cell wall biosynthesis